MEHKPFMRSKSGLVFLVFAGIAGYFLLTEHREHAYAFLPFLFLLACPIMHLFMHGNHSHEDNSKNNESQRGKDGA